jgi:hypothetical protein
MAHSLRQTTAQNLLQSAACGKMENLSVQGGQVYWSFEPLLPPASMILIYETETNPKSWRIPLSNETRPAYLEKSRSFLDYDF